MDVIASAALIVVGLLLIVLSLSSAFRTVVMPRAAFDPLTRAIFLGFRVMLLGLARVFGRLDREVALATHAPLGLLTLAVAWAAGIIFGFTLILFGLGGLTFYQAFVLAGSSFTTLGFQAPESGLQEILAVIAAILGLGVVALLISYLPTIYGLFSRREVIVADIAIKSGGAAHGPALVERLVLEEDTRRLDDLWADWTHWFIALGETHTSEPSLNFFRSPRAARSWLTAAGAVLDAAVIRNHVVAAQFSVRADMTYQAGVETLVAIADFFSSARADLAEQGIGLTRSDFDIAVESLANADVPLVDDFDAAWSAFSEHRSAYEPSLLGLVGLILPPPAPWSTDLVEVPDEAAREGS